MLKKLKISFQEKQLANLKKMTPLTRIGVGLLVISLLMAVPILVRAAIGMFAFLILNDAMMSLWVSYILILVATTLYFDYGKGNLSFVIALGSGLIQALIGYYNSWYGFFNYGLDEAFDDLGWGLLSFEGLLLYLSNGVFLLALLVLILGRPELNTFYKSIWQKTRKFVGA